LIESIVDGMLDNAHIAYQYRPFLKETLVITLSLIHRKDLPYIIPLLIRIYIFEKENIKYSPKEYFNLIHANVEPLFPALRALPYMPYGITNFDPLNILLLEIEKNIIAMLKISFKVKWDF
jgi:hypothetical protein